MENKSLPPNKRFNLIHQDLNVSIPSCLPAKKRKNPLSIDSFAPTITTHNLPAKKRICALHPNLLFGEPFSPIDLNLEYDPSSDQFQHQKKKQEHEKHEHKQESENDNDEEDEDGIICSICQSTDGDTLDPIVFCDGCDLMVHATCYGTPLTNAIPEGDWFCTSCKTTRKNKQTSFTLTCCLCATKGGAIKPTNDGRWAHIVCALFVPEVFFLDPEGRENIDCSMVPKRRWGKTCYVCEKTKGCVVDCCEEKCVLSFHVTCGVKEDLCIEYKQGRNKGDIVAGFCKKHTDLWVKQQATGKYKIVARNEEK